MVLSNQPIFPIKGGYEIRKWGLVSHLGDDIEKDVWYLSAGEPEGHAEMLASGMASVRAFRSTVPRTRPSPWQRLKWLAGRDPESYWELRLGSPELLEALEAGFEEGRWDAVFATGWRILPYMEAVPDHPRVVYDLCDSPSLNLERTYRASPGLRTWQELRMMKAFERRTLVRAEIPLFIADHDADRFRSNTGLTSCQVISNGVRLPASDDTQRNDVAHPTVVFTGVMNYPPNVDAARWLATEIWPRVRTSFPQAELLLVGRNPSEEVLQMGRDLAGVTVTGEVDTLDPYLGNATLFAAPIRLGGGVKNKILEALAFAVPVVGTPVAVEGVRDLRSGENYLLAEDTGEFVRAITELLADGERARAMGAAGRRVVEEHFDWASCARRLETLLFGPEAS